MIDSVGEYDVVRVDEIHRQKPRLLLTATLVMQPLTRFGSDLPVEPETCPGAAIGDRHIAVVGKAERFERLTRARLVAIAHGVTPGTTGTMPFPFLRAVLALLAKHSAHRRPLRFPFRQPRPAPRG